MTLKIKPRFRKSPSKEYSYGYDVTVSISLPADQMESLILAAAAGYREIKNNAASQGFPEDEPKWEAREQVALAAYKQIEEYREAAENERRTKGDA